MTRLLAAVLYDLDGLAVDSEPAHVEAWRRAMEASGAPFEESWLSRFYGRPVSVTAAAFAEEHGLDAVALLAARDRFFDELTAGGIEPMPGLVESVTLLREAGVRVGLVSSGTRPYVERTAAGLRERHGVSFEAVVTRDDVSRPKPDPEPFLRGAELLGAEPGSCAVLEDAPLGIVAAKAAGMVAVAVPNEQTRALEFSGADSVQPDLVAAVRWLLATGQ